MWFGILGATEARLDDGAQVAVGGPRVRALLALLLLDPGRVVPVERLIDGLYGQDPPAGAANALQSQVSRLRRGLRGGLVEFHPAGYRLAVDPDDVDVHRFGRLAREGRRALDAADHARAARLLREALGLWRGPALADVADAPFAAAQIARLEELRASAAEDLAEAELGLGRHRDAVGDLQHLVERHPLRERARALLMRALSGSGRQAEALAVYEDARRTLAEELGADPSPELAAVHLAILQGEAAGTPAAATAPRLPARLTSFVGRAEELRRVGDLLSTGRLLTLTGPGGAGKTRLALEAGALEPGEVCFVDLAPLGDGAEVAGALLGALGLRESGLLPTPGEAPADPVDRLITALADRPMLLILDNCEHVIDDAARLVHRLLGACPRLRVLATSREALGITGEALWPLPPLPVPPPGTPPERALEYPAVRLFADRAAAVRPGFIVDSGNVDLVLRICRGLDGLPLAIELAAARLRSLAPEEIAARLDDRFRLLSRGDRTAAPRHQTLRAVVGWSWELLDGREQMLARRLTVFAGGATARTAAQVCRMPADEVDELLAGLVDKSLVYRDGDRYRMLVTIRAFCAERLDEAGEGEEFRLAHARHYHELARTADPHLRRAEQLDWLARLAAEHDDLHAALRRAIRLDPVLALRLVAALSWYWWLRGRAEGAQLAAELLAAVGDEPPGDLGEEWVLCVANAAFGGLLGDSLDRRLELAERIRGQIDRPLRWPAGIVMWALLGGPERTSMEQHLMHVGDDPWAQAITHIGDGFQHQFAGEPDRAEPEFQAALERFRAVGDRWGMANALDPLAQLAAWRGDGARFHALINEALDLVEQLGAHEERAALLALRAEGLVRDGDYAAARADYVLAAEVARRAGAAHMADGMHHGLGELSRRLGDLAAARRHYEACLQAAAGTWFAAGWTRSQALVGLGWTAEASGDVERARTLHRQALELAREHGNMMFVADAVDGLAGIALADGDGKRAALLLGVAAMLRGRPAYTGPDTARVAAGVRALLGEEAFQAAYERGREMDRERALRLAGG
ncbi:ATP-binding protein [Thermomonospora cellulosilytica]|uniref:Putative ATPase/DNA-binding SARP family transcriptional activator n=1 Tax=Thermomonospora cellulosilytica TaxID=1411118 RepID=A0A7W3MW29_9ACTN|nr:BTAD domain-containing putative transcriptional regulator [Thermomonospora cellulosilytica]MBA9002887.1 putative ATPase/DNA-binding SARP family transcriptional activator [Thermomonospora cellulosilytica]